MHLTERNAPNINMAQQQTQQSNISGAQFGSSPPENWLHSPPSPMPWGVAHPPLVRFTAEPANSVNRYCLSSTIPPPSQTPASFTQPISTYTQAHSCMRSMYIPSSSQSTQPSTTPHHGIKRKYTTADDAEMLCAVNKLHISEKKLAHHHLGEHALAVNASNTLQIRNVSEIGMGQRLVLSDEVQQFPSQEPILPQPLLDRIRQPSMALVLWQPPNPRLFANTSHSSDEEETSQAAVEQDNNNSSTVDLNHLPSFSDPPVSDDQDIEMEPL